MMRQTGYVARTDGLCSTHGRDAKFIKDFSRKTCGNRSPGRPRETLEDITVDPKIQSNLGSQTPRIMNNSVYEQSFRTQSVSDYILCLELRTRKPSTSWSDKLGVSASAVFVEE
jgi:hypothetical protein